MMIKDFVFFIALIIIIKIVVVVVNKIVKDVFIARKVIHLLAGLITSFALFLFNNWYFLYALAIIFIITNYIEIKKNRFKSMAMLNDNLGTIFFPISYLVLILLWGKFNVGLIFISFLIMSISDSFAAIFGVKFGKFKYKLLNDDKTFIGSLVFFFSAYIILVSGIWYFYALPLYILFAGAGLIALFITVLENFSIYGIDNFSVPVIGAFFINKFLNTPYEFLYLYIIAFLTVSVILYISIKLRLLDISGNAAAFITGMIIMIFGGSLWILPMLFFFISGGLLSKYKKNFKEKLSSEYSEKRDAYQVLANSFVAILVAFLYNYTLHTIYIIGFLSIIAAQTADTWGAEFGIVSKENAFLITTFQNIEHGISGAVSISGLIWAFVGSLSISLFSFLFFDSNIVKYIGIITFSGWLAQIVDSILGAKYQALYKCNICGRFVEKYYHCNQKAVLVKGFSLIDNNMVNFLSSIFAFVFSVLIFFK